MRYGNANLNRCLAPSWLEAEERAHKDAQVPQRVNEDWHEQIARGYIGDSPKPAGDRERHEEPDLHMLGCEEDPHEREREAEGDEGGERLEEKCARLHLFEERRAHQGSDGAEK